MPISLLPLLLWACADKDASQDSDAALPDQQDPPSCQPEHPPTINAVRCENTGLATYNPTGEVVPTLTLWADIRDEDGDLQDYTLEVFYDDIIDDVVMTDFSLGISEGNTGQPACSVPLLRVGTQLYLRGGQPLLQTTYEWWVQVTDASAMTSEIVGVVCTTPDAQGEGEVR